MTTIKQLPRDSRPRERLAAIGPAGLSNVELLAILLRTGARKKSALVLAQEILAKFGDLEGLCRARHADLCSLLGIGLGKASEIIAAVELGRRVLVNHLKPRTRLSSPKEVFAYLSVFLKGATKECFLALFLDAKNRLIGQEAVSMGTLDASIAHPREIFQGAIAAGAKSVIVAHNHPSGDPAPSREDKEITKRLRQAGKIIGIELLDHIVVGDASCVSMREEAGWDRLD